MHPEFIRIGPFDIRSYGVLVALGFMVGLYLAAWRGKREGLGSQRIMDLGVWLIIAGMLGAKLYYVVVLWPDFIAGWRVEGLRSLRQGFVFFGGFIGACVATIYYARRCRVSLWKLADVMAPSVALGHAFGRVGCFFNGCCFGSSCDVAWSVRYPVGHPAHSYPSHPVQLYEAAGNLLIFVGLSVWFRHRKFDGQVWWLYTLAYGALRFGIEFIRGDYKAHYFGVYTNAHVIAVLLIAVSVAMLARLGTGRRDEHV
jgi:phosphatidylglycerol:prolipoprotein diacylglycerol transferase